MTQAKNWWSSISSIRLSGMQEQRGSSTLMSHCKSVFSKLMKIQIFC